MLRPSKLIFYLSFLSLGACGALNNNPSNGTSFSPSAEPTFCSLASATTYSPSITIQATAQFRSRVHHATLGLLGATAARGIPYAEVQVVNSAGTVVQCGETALNGAISVTVPKVAGTYTLKVLSRADNNRYKVSVLNNASTNIPYSISVAFSVVGNEAAPVAVTLPVGNYTGNLEGGAFNILEQVYLANKYIQDNSSCPSCTTFTVAPKVSIYWTPGMSPGAYYGSPSTAISFFSKSDDYSIGLLHGIYILGGINGDVNCTDTDHFDNSVILHEYGHFLEESFAGSESPGGSHDGNRLVDPRLAWSEGWANFVQGAFLNRSVYQDTVGNSDCGAGNYGMGVNLNLEVPTAGQDQMLGGTPAGQGIFREVSVSRALYDMYTPIDVNDAFGADIGFPLMWKVFSSSYPNGLYGSAVFRNIGMYNSIMRTTLSAVEPTKVAAFDSVIGSTNEYQDPVNTPTSSLRREYGLPVTPTATPAANCEFGINGVLATYGGVTNFLENEDFFQYYYDGTAANSVITLRYDDPGDTPDDLDLYVYRRNHIFGNTSTMAGRSARLYPESGGGVEVVSLAGQPVGYYLINVSSDRDNLGTSTGTVYHLETDSGAKWICPQ